MGEKGTQEEEENMVNHKCSNRFTGSTSSLSTILKSLIPGQREEMSLKTLRCFPFTQAVLRRRELAVHLYANKLQSVTAHRKDWMQWGVANPENPLENFCSREDNGCVSDRRWSTEHAEGVRWIPSKHLNGSKNSSQAHESIFRQVGNSIKNATGFALGCISEIFKVPSCLLLSPAQPNTDWSNVSSIYMSI